MNLLTNIQSLPNELLFKVLRPLSTRALLEIIPKVCKAWLAIAQTPEFWKYHQLDFPHTLLYTGIDPFQAGPRQSTNESWHAKVPRSIRSAACQGPIRIIGKQCGPAMNVEDVNIHQIPVEQLNLSWYPLSCTVEGVGNVSHVLLPSGLVDNQVVRLEHDGFTLDIQIQPARTLFISFGNDPLNQQHYSILPKPDLAQGISVERVLAKPFRKQFTVLHLAKESALLGLGVCVFYYMAVNNFFHDSNHVSERILTLITKYFSLFLIVGYSNRLATDIHNKITNVHNGVNYQRARDMFKLITLIAIAHIAYSVIKM